MRYAFSPLLLVVFFSLAGCAQVERTARPIRDGDGTATVTAADWSMDATGYADRVGSRYVYTCPSNGTAGIVWGSNPYTSDSSVCTAGVHAGVISTMRGGRVLIEMRPGQDSYAGSMRNGVSSSDWGSWGSSFRVITQ